MKNLIFVWFISFSITPILSQNIEGVVLDVITNKPIPEAHVYINSIKQGTLTNFRGKFKIKPSLQLKKDDTIYFSHIGYKQQAILYSKKKKQYLVYLEVNTNKLNEIQLIGKRKLNPTLGFNKLTSMKKGIYSFGSVLKGNKIYVIGGNSTFERDNMRKTAELNPDYDLEELIRSARSNFSYQKFRGELLYYNLESDIWETDTLKFRERAFHNINIHDNKIYVIGGTRISKYGTYQYLDDKIEVLDLENKTIKIDDTNPHQAVNFVSFSHGDDLILMGGSIKKKKNGQRTYSNKVHLYNPKSGIWYELDNMTSAKEVKGILIANKIYLFGGFNKKSLTEIESLDLTTGKWQKEGELFSGFRAPAITHANQIIYIYENGKFATYDINTKELKQYSIELFLNASELHYANNKLYLLGGFTDDNFSILPSRDMFRIDLNQFETTKVNNSKRLKY